MDISVFEVLGPVMIGPSSSHTAGAVRLAHVAAEVARAPFHKVRFGLSGSFAKTCRGHGTDKALLAGAMGLAPDDERIRDAEGIARERGLEYRFEAEELDWLHENSVHITFTHENGAKSEIWGSSIGGGRIVIRRIGDFETSLEADSPTVVVVHKDQPGVISDLSTIFAWHGINIGVLRLTRVGKHGKAAAMFILDEHVTPKVVAAIKFLPYVEEVAVIDVP